MALAAGNSNSDAYSTLELVKGHLGKETVDNRDEMIDAALLAASRMIDSGCGKPAGAFRPAATPSTRVFLTQGRVFPMQNYRYGIQTDDISTATGLIVEGGLQASGLYSPVTPFTVGPFNATAYGTPFTWVSGAYTFFSSIDSVRITATWGWPAIPAGVELATRLMAARLYRRKDSPQGVIASPDFGGMRVSRFDPDVRALLAAFITPGFA